jgi:hypothetical protein
LAAVFALAWLTGCSHWPWQTIPPVFVPNDQYVVMSCAELQDENERLMLTAVDLHPQIFPPQGEEQREMDVALVGGALDALNRVRNAKKC